MLGPFKFQVHFVCESVHIFEATESEIFSLQEYIH